MLMKIPRHSFEFNFSASALQSGLRWFRSGAVSEEKKTGGAKRSFNVRHETVQAQVHAHHASNLVCSCGRTFCPHMAAVLFFLNGQLFEQELQERQSGKKQPTGKTSAAAFVRQLKSCTGIEEIERAAAQFRKAGHDAFTTDLLVITEAVLYRQPAHREWLDRKKHQVIKAANGILTTKQFEVLEEAVFDSVRSSQALTSGVFFDLLPLYVARSGARPRLPMLADTLGRRKRKRLFSEKTDPMKEASFLISYATADVEVLPKSHDPAEAWMAAVRLKLLRNKVRAAFNILQRGKDEIRINFPAQFLPFLEWGTGLAAEHKNRELELMLLKEKMTYALSFTMQELAHLKKLAGNKTYQLIREEMIRELSVHDNDFSADKILLLLRDSGDWKQLAEFLRGKNAHLFDVMDAAMGMLPDVPAWMGSLIARHLGNETKNHAAGKSSAQMLNVLVSYLRLIGPGERVQVLKPVLEHAGYRSSFVQTLAEKLALHGISLPA